MDKIYGLLGRKLSHSYSVPIHKELGNKCYALYELEPFKLNDFFLRDDIGGLNVTIPYKRDVMNFCDVIDNAAIRVGSVNTIVRRENKLYGYNTDVYGFIYMAKRTGIELTQKKVVILGSGGAYLAVKAAVNLSGAREVVCISRSGEDNYNNIHRHLDAEIIVNATPVGMYPNNGESPVDLSLFKNLEGALDLIYNPARTAFLMQAQRLNIPCIGGLSMLVAQAKAAEEIFFDKKIQDDKIDAIIKILSTESENIVLIGMPGCGKTCIGEALSKLTGRESIDTDALIEEKSGLSISDIFKKYGESEFRRMEREAIVYAGKMSGKIIMTGGGVVKDKRNLMPLYGNGRIYHVIRDINKLSRDNRPLSENADLEKMYKERLPMYKYFRDAYIENNDTPDAAAKEIWRDFCENTRN